MKLFLVHCGYYDPEVAEGMFEQHTCFFVVADSVENARIRAKSLEVYKGRRMHIDGLQEITAVDGHNIQLSPAPEGTTHQSVKTYNFRSLAPTAEHKSGLNQGV